MVAIPRALAEMALAEGCWPRASAGPSALAQEQEGLCQDSC